MTGTTVRFIIVAAVFLYLLAAAVKLLLAAA